MALNGQTIVTAAGTPEVFSTVAAVGPGTVLVRAIPGNTGDYCYIGFTSLTATSEAGYVINKTDDEIALTLVDPADLWVDSDTSGDKICWIMSEGENQRIKAPAA